MPRWNDVVPVLCRFSAQPDSIVAKRHLPHRFRGSGTWGFHRLLSEIACLDTAGQRTWLPCSWLMSLRSAPIAEASGGDAGDAITIESDAIHLSTISGSSRWPAARHEDSAGRLLPGSSLESGMIPDGMCLALSDHPGSFDSRFFGLVPLADVVKVKPVFTIKE